MGGASRDGRNFGPETTFLCLVNYDFDFHGYIIRVLGIKWRGLSGVRELRAGVEDASVSLALRTEIS